MADLFDDQKPTFVPRSDRVKPWDPAHPDHPSQRPHNELKPGEDPPASWNVAQVEMGIAEMRAFLEWCASRDIVTDGHSVGTLYCALNAHSKASFKWLCQALSRTGIGTLPNTGALQKAMLKRDEALLYDNGDR